MKYILLFLISLSLEAKSLSPLIIGHRGASGHKPEHTLASYQLAIDMKADYIEPDLVMTKDKVLVTRHENELSGTTDVAEKFPSRKATKKIDGVDVTGWFSEDLTLKEIKTLRAKERLPARSHAEDFKYEIPTFQEVIDLVKKESKKQKRKIGLYPEMKHPSYFKSIGLPIEKAMVDVLTKNGLNKKDSPVFIQSFEMTSLKEVKKISPLPLVFLLDDPNVIPYDHVLAKDPRTYLQLLNPDEFKKMKETITAIGPHKNYLIPVDKEGHLQKPTPLLKMAHEAGLQVHPYTFRSDKEFLPKDYEGNPEKEYHRFFELGVDAVFSDFPDDAIKARESFFKNKEEAKQ